MEEIFSDVLSGNTDSLGDAIQFFIAVAEEWANAQWIRQENYLKHQPD